MMSENKGISSLAIILLIVGLVVGAGGSYVFVSNPLNANIDSLSAELSDLQATLEEQNSELSELEESYSELVSDSETLEDEIQEISSDIAQTENEIEQIDHTTEVNLEKIAHYSVEVEPDNGYKTFSIYAFGFQYPVGMVFELVEFQENPITEDYGILEGTIVKQDRDEEIRVVWQKTDFEADAESDLNDLVTGYVEQCEEDDSVTTETGSVQVSERLNHIVYSQKVTCTTESTSWIVYYSTWYCNLDSLFYRMIYVSETPDSDDFDHYLSTTLCHR